MFSLYMLRLWWTMVYRLNFLHDCFKFVELCNIRTERSCSRRSCYEYWWLSRNKCCWLGYVYNCGNGRGKYWILYATWSTAATGYINDAYVYYVVRLQTFSTRMHSTRMRIARSSLYGGVPERDPLWTVTSLDRHPRYRDPPWTEWHTGVKTLPSRNFACRR